MKTKKRKSKRISCYQPIQMITDHGTDGSGAALIDGVIVNASHQGLFIRTVRPVKTDKLFFSYEDVKTRTQLHFDCELVRSEPEGVAVRYRLYPQTDAKQPPTGVSDDPDMATKGRFLNRCA